MYLPDIFKKFREEFPQIVDSYHKTGELCSNAGPLDSKTRHLVQLGVAVGARSKGAVRSHVRRALEAGASKEEVIQVILLSMTIIGFPSTIASYEWAEEVLSAAKGEV